MTSEFDPETGLRSTEPVADGPRGRRRPSRNPYETALAVLWITSAALAFALLVSGSVGVAALVAVFGAFVGVAHLTARAITWQPVGRDSDQPARSTPAVPASEAAGVTP